MKRFYVYRIFDGMQTLYVGKGSGRRLANQKKRFRVQGEILEWFDDEAEAYAREAHWIVELKPTENKSEGGDGGWAIPLDPMPKNCVGQITDKEWRAACLEQRRFEREYHCIGPRRYVAQYLMRVHKVAPHLIDASKVELIRQVANGPRV